MATKLDLADAQFIGWSSGRRQPSIIEMIQSMGLKKGEWEKWKKNYTTTYLSSSERLEIDDFFNSKPLSGQGRRKSSRNKKK